MPPQQALTLARSKGLDLVEVAAAATPPVCRIMDFGKYQYQEQKRAREARKHQKVIEVKEIKFRPKVDEHDFQFKKKHIERFLADGDKVKATIFFRGREMAHPEIGLRNLEIVTADMNRFARARPRRRRCSCPVRWSSWPSCGAELAWGVGTEENMPRREANTMHVILAKRPGSGPKQTAAPRAHAPSAQARPLAAEPVVEEVPAEVDGEPESEDVDPNA